MIFHAYSILSADEADGMVKQLLEIPWSEGRARTERLTGTIKKNREADSANTIVKALSRHIGEALIKHADILAFWVPEKLSGVKFNRYSGGETYHRHTDSPLMGDVRSDMASTIFLTDPSEYDGGELCVEIDGEVFSHKGKKGDCVVYPCGYPHWVNRVTRGERISGFTWMQSYIQNHKQREILRNVQKLCFALEEEMNPDDDNDKFRRFFVDCGQVHGDLMRMWM